MSIAKTVRYISLLVCITEDVSSAGITLMPQSTASTGKQ